MISTFPYDSSGTLGFRAFVDADAGRATIIFFSEGERIVAESPFDGPKAPESLRARLRDLIQRKHDKWRTYCELLVRNRWSADLWRTAARGAAFRKGLPNGFDEDVLQAALLSLCELLHAKIELLVWLEEKESLEHFDRWFRKFVFNLSNAAARNHSAFAHSQERQGPAFATDAFLEGIADYREKGSKPTFNEMLAILARYPEPTRAVVLLRYQSHTWDEVAEILCISVDAARWAVDAYRDELHRDFESFR
jgi:DNA-directed RNA polymerase specialized sigma24 family protein